MSIKVKNKKSLFAICTLLLVVVFGVTYATFFSSSNMLNLFNIGNYNVVTSETFTSPASWQPGVEIPKSITATNNGDIQAAFRVKYTESWVDSNNNSISNVPEDAVSINFINKHDWIYNSDDGYYYYKWIINSGDTTSSLISGITLNQSLTGNASCVEDGNTYNCSSNISGLEGATYTLTFTKETVAYSKYQSFWGTDQNIIEFRYLYTLPEGRTAYNLQVGDEICVNDNTTECFTFIRYDENNNIVMLAKYNLKVGKSYDSSGTQTGIYSSDDTGYGLQSSDAKGFISGQARYGTVAFSALNYWYSGGLKPKYGSSYPANVYDTDYTTEPDFSNNGFNTTGYSVAYYVEEYKDKLEDYGVRISDARLLTYAESLNLSLGDNNTSFWLGSASDYYYVWYMSSDGSLAHSISSRNDGYFGVRPVIVLSKSEVNNNVADANKKYVAEISLPSGRTKDTLEVGDEVCINGDTTECFNFYGYDGDNVKLLSKWNLKVGNFYDSSGTKIGVYSSDDTGYGLQSSDAKGHFNSDESLRIGTVAFSATNYWYDGSALKSKYGSAWNDNNVYDTDYLTEPDFSVDGFSTTGYSIAYYVEEYKKVLEDYGVTISDARLLTISERPFPDEFIGNTSFWLGSAGTDTVLWCILSGSSGGDVYSMAFNKHSYLGVRPVIVINKNDL